MKHKKVLYITLSILLMLTILIMPTVVWQFMLKVETRTVISLTKEGSLLPKSVVQQGDNPCVFQLVSNQSFWTDGFIAKRTEVKVIKVDEDSVMVAEKFHPSQELVVLGKYDLYDGIHVRRSK
ncbi:hypothetical protein EHE19_004710 [Ruminiclostridium herbifermentans]|uniref:Uncharacterized protein n=1 Tax=Ruminiclostridium herbifermentans TaxID=2488810 RepID=A0A4U7JCJ4_9FIRM|nr:hypothetical protein [Ruminiclostridium herbifermentans]QNU67770.1 hypothetical protein EHE19_004710 [Ruminiclostridium herbifermentans]